MIWDVLCDFSAAVELISWTIVDDDGESLEVSSVCKSRFLLCMYKL